MAAVLLLTDDLSELTSRGSNVIGEHIVLGIPMSMWIPRVGAFTPDGSSSGIILGFTYVKRGSFAPLTTGMVGLVLCAGQECGRGYGVFLPAAGPADRCPDPYAREGRAAAR
jgi:hypothetical protein